VELDVRYDYRSDAACPSDWTPEGMQVSLPAGGQLRIDWPHRVELSVPDSPEAECVVQPFLTTAAASIALHGGHQPFHAGALGIDGAAWAILGDKEAGKSSTLALAARMGVPVITDDLLVVADGLALAGPRCLDLREEPAAFIGGTKPLGMVGLRERWRLYLDPCPPATPLAGFVVPTWGTDAVELLAPVARLETIFESSSLQGITMNDPGEYLWLASLPTVEWSRPRDLSSASRSLELLLAALARQT
jgi:hypothetical protein